MAYYPQPPQPSLSQPTAKESLKALLAQREAQTQPKPKVSDKPRTFTVLKGHMRVNAEFTEGKLSGNVMLYKEVSDAVNQADYLLCGLCESTRLFRSLQTLWKHRQDSCCFKAPNAPVSPDEDDDDMEVLAENARKDLEAMTMETLTGHYKQVVGSTNRMVSKAEMIDAIIAALTSEEPPQPAPVESAFSSFAKNRSTVIARTFPSLSPEDVSVMVCREWELCSLERLPFSSSVSLRCSAATQTFHQTTAITTQTDVPVSHVKPHVQAVKVKAVQKPQPKAHALRAKQKIRECGNCRACYPTDKCDTKIWYCDTCRTKWLIKMHPQYRIGDAVGGSGIAQHGHWPCIVSTVEMTAPDDEEPYRVSYWWAGKKKTRAIGEDDMHSWGELSGDDIPPAAVKWVTDQIMEIASSQETVDARNGMLISDLSPTARR